MSQPVHEITLNQLAEDRQAVSLARLRRMWLKFSSHLQRVTTAVFCQFHRRLEGAGQVARVQRLGLFAGGQHAAVFQDQHV